MSRDKVYLQLFSPPPPFSRCSRVDGACSSVDDLVRNNGDYIGPARYPLLQRTVYVSDIGLKITRSFYLDLPVDLQFFFTVSCIKVNLSRFWVMLDIIMGNGESRRKLRETRQERKCINLCCTTSIIIRIILNSTSGRILRKEMQKDPQGTWRYGGNSHGMALVSRPPFN